MHRLEGHFLITSVLKQGEHFILIVASMILLFPFPYGPVSLNGVGPCNDITFWQLTPATWTEPLSFAIVHILFLITSTRLGKEVFPHKLWILSLSRLSCSMKFFSSTLPVTTISKSVWLIIYSISFCQLLSGHALYPR